VETTTAKSAQTFSASIAPSSLPQPSAQAISGAIGPPQVAPLQMALVQMAPQPQQMAPQPQQMAPQQMGSGMFPQGVAAPVMTYEGASELQMVPQPQHIVLQQLGSGMFPQGAAAQVMTYAAPTSQASSPPHIAPLQVAPQPQQMAPQQISQMSTPQMGLPQMAPLQMAQHSQQTTQWQTGSGMFSQGAAAPVVTYETPASQVPSSSVNSPALQADAVTESKLGSQATERHTAKDDAIRNKFKNRVAEAVSHGEETITIPTKMVIGLLEMVLPESDCADLKPLKVTKSRSKRGFCCDF